MTPSSRGSTAKPCAAMSWASRRSGTTWRCTPTQPWRLSSSTATLLPKSTVTRCGRHAVGVPAQSLHGSSLHGSSLHAAVKQPAATCCSAACLQVLHLAEVLHNTPKHPLCVKALQRRAAAYQVRYMPLMLLLIGAVVQLLSSPPAWLVALHCIAGLGAAQQGCGGLAGSC